jgi:hypothetical protein
VDLVSKKETAGLLYKGERPREKRKKHFASASKGNKGPSLAEGRTGQGASKHAGTFSLAARVWRWKRDIPCLLGVSSFTQFMFVYHQ